MSAYDDRLNEIYDSTAGRCHICRKKLSFRNYASLGRKGAWEVDHSNPRARGGSDRLNNLRPACISCNRSKQHRTTRTARAWHGHTSAPRSRVTEQRVEMLKAIATLGAVVLGLIAATRLSKPQPPSS